MDPTKIEEELDWHPEVDFEEGLARTIRWYQEHADWWRRVKDGSYREYYEKWYGR